MDKRRCTVCNKSKSLDDFYKTTRGWLDIKPKYRSECKECNLKKRKIKKVY